MPSDKYSTALALTWVTLIIMLLGGTAIHTNAWNIYWGLWITEAIAFGLAALACYLHKTIVAIGSLAASTVWLLNQVTCWYYAGANYPLVYMVTCALNIIVIVFVLLTMKRSSEGGNWFAAASFGVLTIFALWKIYEVNKQFMPGTPIYNSAFLWGAGIMIMAIGSLLPPLFNQSEGAKKIGAAVAVIGLLVAAYAALAYGIGLSIIGPTI